VGQFRLWTKEKTARPKSGRPLQWQPVQQIQERTAPLQKAQGCGTRFKYTATNIVAREWIYAFGQGVGEKTNASPAL
jgi:hypothetical protein